MENQQQFEFCHRVLEEVMWGRVAAVEEEDGARRGGRGKKWKLFRRRKKNGDSCLHSLCVVLVKKMYNVRFSIIRYVLLKQHSKYGNFLSLTVKCITEYVMFACSFTATTPCLS